MAKGVEGEGQRGWRGNRKKELYLSDVHVHVHTHTLNIITFIRSGYYGTARTC